MPCCGSLLQLARYLIQVPLHKVALRCKKGWPFRGDLPKLHLHASACRMAWCTPCGPCVGLSLPHKHINTQVTHMCHYTPAGRLCYSPGRLCYSPGRLCYSPTTSDRTSLILFTSPYKPSNGPKPWMQTPLHHTEQQVQGATATQRS